MEQALEVSELTEEFIKKRKNLGWISSLAYYEKSPVGGFSWYMGE